MPGRARVAQASRGARLTREPASAPFAERLLDLNLVGPGVVPRYLTGAADRALAAEALAAVRDLAGRPRAEVEATLTARRQEHPGRHLAWLALTQLVRGCCGYRVNSPVQPAVLREALFLAAAGATDPGAILGQVAAGLDLSAQALLQCLYADMPAERVLAPVPDTIGVRSLVSCYNLSLAQGLLVRAEQVSVTVSANWAAILRHASRQRLLCLARRQRDGVSIEVSGPLSLFHHTTKYGRALAGWLQLVVRAPGWRLAAHCRLRRGGRRIFRADHRDPISAVATRPLRPFDSELERGFARDMARVAGDRFELLREADPVQLPGARIVCPDFTLVPRGGTQRVAVEIVGFWTSAYLTRKLALLQALSDATSAAWVVCIDERLAAGREAELPRGPLFRFRRRIVVEEFVEFVERLLAA